MRAPHRFTDDSISRLPLAAEAYSVRDTALARFFVRVSKKHRTFCVQAERPAKFGDRRTFLSRLGRHPMITVDTARAAAVDWLRRVDKGEDVAQETAPERGPITVGAALDDYVGWLKSQNKSPRGIAEVEGTRRRCLDHLASTTLLSLVENPAVCRDLHRKISKERGPVEADHAMRVLRAAHNRAARADRTLTGTSPVVAVDWSPQGKKRRDLAIPFHAMPEWRAQIEKLRASNPIRASYHLLCLFTGARPGELARSRWQDVDVRGRTLTLHDIKTAPDIVIPLSREIVAELRRVRDAGRMLYPGCPWIFPADSARGYIVRWAEKRSVLAHWGNAGRHSHRTIAAALGIDLVTSRLLLGHTLTGISLGYVTRAALIGTSLRGARREGWAAMRDLLFNSKEGNGRPGIWVSERCTNWWTTVPQVPRDPNHPEDLFTGGVDHAADASRYAATHIPQITKISLNPMFATSTRSKQNG